MVCTALDSLLIVDVGCVKLSAVQGVLEDEDQEARVTVRLFGKWAGKGNKA